MTNNFKGSLKTYVNGPSNYTKFNITDNVPISDSDHDMTPDRLTPANAAEAKMHHGEGTEADVNKDDFKTTGSSIIKDQNQEFEVVGNAEANIDGPVSADAEKKSPKGKSPKSGGVAKGDKS